MLREAPRQLRGVLPAGFVLQLYEWDEVPGGEDWHDRLFLTDAGGLTIGAGFATGGPGEKANFMLLDDRHAHELRSYLAPDSTVYVRVGSAVQIELKW